MSKKNIPASLIKRIQKLTTTEVADAYVKYIGLKEDSIRRLTESRGSGKGINTGNLPFFIGSSNQFQCINGPNMSRGITFGPAFTIQVKSVTLEKGEKETTSSSSIASSSSSYHFTDMVGEGEIVLASVSSRCGNAIFGGMMMTRLLVRKAAGLVTNGYVRDVIEIQDGVTLPSLSSSSESNPTSSPSSSSSSGSTTSKLAVYARGASMLPPKPFSRVVGGHNIPINFGRLPTVKVWPGDYVFADSNGVLIIPSENRPLLVNETASSSSLRVAIESVKELETLIREAELIREKEEKIMRDLREGKTFEETISKYKRF